MSGYQNAMKAVAYQTPYERNGCHNCNSHTVQQDKSNIGKRTMRCTPNGFLVSPLAICKQWSKAK